MGRPRSDEERVLECAEGISATLINLAELAVIQDVLLRQVRRRVFGTSTMDSVAPAIEQLETIAAEIQTARSLAFEMLKTLQEGRQ